MEVNNRGGLSGYGQVKVLGRLIGANMNSTADQPISINLAAGTKYVITEISAMNASTNLNAAVGGIYSAASKGGRVIVTAITAWATLSDATKVQIPTVSSRSTINTESVLYLSLTIAQGAEATADFYILGYVL